MIKTFTTLLLLSFSLFSVAQTQITNGGFEAWGGNPSPGITAEPTGFYSNDSGSSTAQLGPQTCFQDATIKHSGSYSIRLENKTVPIVGTVVNGNATTGVINAPSSNKADGYIGTINYSSASDIRRMTFTGRPDSIVGWYQYTSGGTGEQGKVTAILHNNNYYDPETPTTNHPDPTADKVARATFLTPTGSSSTWKRFTAPFVYTSTGNPTYIMLNMTPSNNQLTTFAGSKIWIDDISFIYNSSVSVKEQDLVKNAKVYYFEKNIYVSLKDNDTFLVELFDVTGQLVLSQNADNSSSKTIDVSSLKTGVYMYRLNGRSQSKFGKLFID
ncbi:MAG: T9SS type A sorting domain-containing protein [Bacteroidota bacterium]